MPLWAQNRSRSTRWPLGPKPPAQNRPYNTKKKVPGSSPGLLFNIIYKRPGMWDLRGIGMRVCGIIMGLATFGSGMCRIIMGSGTFCRVDCERCCLSPVVSAEIGTRLIASTVSVLAISKYRNLGSEHFLPNLTTPVQNCEFRPGRTHCKLSRARPRTAGYPRTEILAAGISYRSTYRPCKIASSSLADFFELARASPRTAC